MTVVRARGWLLSAALAFAPVAAFAQDSTTTPEPAPAGAATDQPASQGTEGAQGAQGAQGDVGVAKVGPIEVMLSEIVAQMYNVPAETRKNQDFDETFRALRDQRIDRLMAYQAALEANLDQQPVHAERMRQLEQRVLGDSYMQREIGARVTEDALRARYDRKASEMSGVEEVHGRHILAQTEAEAAAHKAKIDAGADFVELAKSLGFAGSENGGDLGFFRREAMVPEIAEAAFKLKAGEVSGPVQSQFGWHLVKVDERRPVPAKTFEDMRAEIGQELTQEAIDQVLGELAQKIPVKRFERDGSPGAAPEPPKPE